MKTQNICHFIHSSYRLQLLSAIDLVEREITSNGSRCVIQDRFLSVERSWNSLITKCYNILQRPINNYCFKWNSLLDIKPKCLKLRRRFEFLFFSFGCALFRILFLFLNYKNLYSISNKKRRKKIMVPTRRVEQRAEFYLATK